MFCFYGILIFMKKEEILKRIQELEETMNGVDFWNNKSQAQALLREYQDLKSRSEGGSKYDAGNALVTIFAGAGGDDAEDFVRILFDMYGSFCIYAGFECIVLEKNQNSLEGYRSITFSIQGKNAYKKLRLESGVHRLVRLSPFNAKGKRSTSFALVEVIPDFGESDGEEVFLDEKDIDISFTRSGGPGGQNVNKRETAVRMVHRPTGISVHVTEERSQEQNKIRAYALLRAKLYKKQEEERQANEEGYYISKTTDNEWGSQMRSYVLHPYKLIKNHRTGTETSDIDAVLKNGDIEKLQ
jgi:peptide chain release factor 2